MIVVSRSCRSKLLSISAIFLYLIGGKMAPSQVSHQVEPSRGGQAIGVVIRTDRGKYSLGDSVRLDVSLQNTGDAPLYVDRRMFWGGFGGGLKLEISDEQGKAVPLRILNDAIMPPPREGDTSILVRLDKGFFYGTWVDVPVKDSARTPGKYSIRVIYKSWLRKEFVEPQLRELPAVWADTPQIASAPVWIDVVQ
jgi:hypothetical protein